MLKKMWPYLLVCAVLFYAPLGVLKGIKMGDAGVLMLLLLAVLPLTCLIASIVFAARHKFHLLFPICMAVLFVPVVLIFMDGLHNSSGWIYVPAYLGISLAGGVLGNIRNWKK